MDDTSCKHLQSITHTTVTWWSMAIQQLGVPACPSYDSSSDETTPEADSMGSTSLANSANGVQGARVSEVH